MSTANYYECQRGAATLAAVLTSAGWTVYGYGADRSNGLPRRPYGY